MRLSPPTSVPGAQGRRDPGGSRALQDPRGQGRPGPPPQKVNGSTVEEREVENSTVGVGEREKEREREREREKTKLEVDEMGE